jgi:hypothetical protein
MAGKTIKKHSVLPVTKREFVFFLPGTKAEPLKWINESILNLKKEYLPISSFSIICPVDVKNDLLLGMPDFVKIMKPKEASAVLAEINDESQCIVWDDISGLNSILNFNEFYKQDFPHVPINGCHNLRWRNHTINISPGLIIHPLTVKYIISQHASSGNSLFNDLSFYLKALRIKQLPDYSINADCPFEAPDAFHEKSGFLAKAKRAWKWNILNPLREKSVSGLFTRMDHPYSRLVFVLLAALIFIILPLISYNAGISGDEEKHYMHAEKVYNFYATLGKDKSALSDPQLKLNYYGQSFDLLTYLTVKILNTEQIYEVRHVLNGLFGALTILVLGLLARYLAGNITGILAMVFAFFTPHFLGHSMNNPMDIPFALGYIFTIFQLIRFLDRLPIISYRIALWIALGIAFTISIRIGGLLLIPYLFMFSGLYILLNPFPWKIFSKMWWQFALKGLKILIIVSLAGYFVSLIPWPYGLVNPLKNPLESLKMMSNIDVSLRVLFDGSIHWSDKLPWFYIPKNISISVPVIVLLGFLMSLFLFSLWNKIYKPFWFFMLLFVTVFPVIYVIYKESNVYGSWRHLLFIYPSMVVLAASSFKLIYLAFDKNKFAGMFLLFTIILSLFKPALHIVKNYPVYYIYFNQLAGGVNKAYRNHETDYYLNSLKPGSDWLIKNVIEARDASSEPLKIITNAPALITNYYFKDHLDKVSTAYTRYYDRGMHDWDYAVFFCNYIDPYQIRTGIWPPKNTVYEVKVDDVIVGAVVKRENKDDFVGTGILSQGLNERNMLLINDGLTILERAAAYDPNNEVAWMNLATGISLFKGLTWQEKDSIAYWPFILSTTEL